MLKTSSLAYRPFPQASATTPRLTQESSLSVGRL